MHNLYNFQPVPLRFPTLILLPSSPIPPRWCSKSCVHGRANELCWQVLSLGWVPCTTSGKPTSQYFLIQLIFCQRIQSIYAINTLTQFPNQVNPSILYPLFKPPSNLLSFHPLISPSEHRWMLYFDYQKPMRVLLYCDCFIQVVGQPAFHITRSNYIEYYRHRTTSSYPPL